MTPLFFRCIVCLAIMIWSPSVFCAESIEGMIHRADQVRSSKPVEFQGILKELNARASSATAEQRKFIRYLNAYSVSFSGNLDAGIRLAAPLLDRSNSVDMRFMAGGLIVNDYALDGRYNDGLRQLDETIGLADKVKDVALREHGLMAAASLYNQIGQYLLGKQYAEQVLVKPQSLRSKCFAEYYKFESEQKLGTLPQNNDSLLGAIANCDAQHEIVMAGLLRATLARKMVSDGHTDDAILLLKAHLSEAQSTGYPRVIAEVRSLLASLEFEKGDIAGAEENAKSTAQQGAAIVTTPPVVSALLTLYRIADLRGEPAAALVAYKRYAEADRGYLEEVKARELAYHLVREEARQKNQQIELLNRKNSLLQLQQKVDQQAAENSRLLMLLFALLTATIAFWAYKTKRMQMSVKRMAETDSLTGISNRHHFTKQAESTLAQCRLAGEPASMLMFDLDYFKSINDSYGHVTGDWVLKRVAEVCAELCRKIDHLGRVGGEEFALLLHGCDLKAATRVAEDCRVRLSCIETSPSGYTFPVSASFGVSCSSASGFDLDKLISHADQMLYRAKREGRNRVRSYVPDVSVELTGTDFGKKSRPAMDATGAVDSLRA